MSYVQKGANIQEGSIEVVFLHLNEVSQRPLYSLASVAGNRFGVRGHPFLF